MKLVAIGSYLRVLYIVGRIYIGMPVYKRHRLAHMRVKWTAVRAGSYRIKDQEDYKDSKLREQLVARRCGFNDHAFRIDDPEGISKRGGGEYRRNPVNPRQFPPLIQDERESENREYNRGSQHAPAGRQGRTRRVALVICRHSSPGRLSDIAEAALDRISPHTRRADLPSTRVLGAARICKAAVELTLQADRQVRALDSRIRSYCWARSENR